MTAKREASAREAQANKAAQRKWGLRPAKEKDEKEWVASLERAVVDALKAVEGDEEKLKIQSAELRTPIERDAVRAPNTLAAEDDECAGSNDLGALVGHLPDDDDHGVLGGAFLATFTRVVDWPETSFGTLPDVPEGMRLRAKPTVVDRWRELGSELGASKGAATIRNESGGTGGGTGNNHAGAGVAPPPLVPITGFHGVVLSDAVDRVRKVYAEPRTLSLTQVQHVAEKTRTAEKQRGLALAEVEMRRDLQRQREQEAVRNQQRLWARDIEEGKAWRAQRLYARQVREAASTAVCAVTEQSTQALHHAARHTSLMSAHTASAMRLKSLEESSVSTKADMAKDFVAQMRRKGDRQVAQTRRKLLGALGEVLPVPDPGKTAN